MSAGGVVAAVRGRIIRSFANACAFSETDAKTKEELGLQFVGRGIFSRMVKRGIIIETGDNRYYMDKVYCDTRMRRMKVIRPIAFSILFGCVVWLVIWAFLSTR